MGSLAFACVLIASCSSFSVRKDSHEQFGRKSSVNKYDGIQRETGIDNDESGISAINPCFVAWHDGKRGKLAR